MGRKASRPLEKKDIILYEGDWDRLAEILGPTKIKPTVFIRELVRKTIARIEAKAAETHRPVTEIKDDDLGDIATLASATDESE